MSRSKSSSSTVQKETNETNISTITDIRGGIGVTGQDAVNLVAVAGQIGSNLTSQAAAVAQSQLQAVSSGTSALAQASKGITKAITDLSASQDSTPEIVAVVIVGAVLVGAIFLTRR